MGWDPKHLLFSATVAAGLASGSSALAASPYTLFEAGQVRPLALSPDGKLLFAVNTPDGRLEVFRVTGDGLHHQASVPVGLEPVAVAARSNDEVWVVNHLSDSVSIVKLDHDDNGGVVRTLLVGDEPRDLVFAGPGRGRAFITTAHRGQNSPVDPQITTPGVGRADVWVFDADHLGGSLGGDPLTIVNLFTDTPRALAVSPDGGRVYAAGFHSGNRTTTIQLSAFSDEELALLPGPTTNFQGVAAPATGIIVRFDGSHWVDEGGHAWDDKVRFSLPDKDVFVLDATAQPPAMVPGGSYAGVGTILYNLAVNPASGRVYVSNTEATGENGAVAGPRVALLESRADVGECDLVAKSWLGSQELGFLYVGGGEFLTDHQGAPLVDEAWVRATGTAGERALTFTCVPPGEGMRVALGDGDGDGDDAQ